MDAVHRYDVSGHKFTGKERDSESGLDNFGARYMGSSLGRFMSPDDGTDHDSANPQSLNRYSYVLNNPLRFTDPFGHSTQTADNGDVLAVYDDGDNGVYQHTDIDNRSDWDGSKLDSDDEGTNYMGETPRWDEFAAHDRAHPNGISGSAMKGARIHFGQSLDRDIADLNAIANKQSLGVTALFERNGQSFDIKTGAFADSGPGTGYLLNGTYQTIESAGNYLAGLNSQTGTFLGKHISPEMAQKLFGAYQQGGGGTTGLRAVMKTFVTGKEYPGTSGPYWGEIPYSGYAQQEGINAGAQK
jgi:RHS repeat-associated protein